MSSAKMKFIGYLVLCTMMMAAGTLLAGEKTEGALLATVGDVEIRSIYYEDRLGLMEEEELPKDEDGKPLSMLSSEGITKFLEILINKELLVMEARDQEYHQRPETVGAFNSLLNKEAEALMWAAVDKPATKTPSKDEVDRIYSLLGLERKCNFVITNLEKEADAAYQMALGGADWADIVAEFHDGTTPPDGSLPVVNIPYGRYSEDFDNLVFALDVGETGKPLEAGAGFWVIKVISEENGEKSARDDAEEQIVDLIKRREITARRNDFQKNVLDDYKLILNEEALYIAFSGLPEGESTLDPETQKPVAREALVPMVLDPAKEELLLFSYEIDGVSVTMNLREYKNHFDNSNVFERPKKTGMLGGMRGKMNQDLAKVIMVDQAKKEGWVNDPIALGLVNKKIDEIITMALFRDSVIINEEVTDEDRAAFWAEHSDDYYFAERRGGHQVICSNRKSAEEATLLIKEGESWEVILEKFDIDDNNQSQYGNFQVTANDKTPLKDVVFAMEAIGDISAPYSVGRGQYGVVKLENIYPRVDDVPMTTVVDAIDSRVLSMRQEADFLSFLDSLRIKFPVVLHEDNFKGLKGWQELYSARMAAEFPVKN